MFSSINDAIAFCEAAKYDELWIIGGSRIYNDFLNTYCDKINRVYITCVCKNGYRENYDCDTFIDIPDDSYLVEEKIYNAVENCYYLTCVHKMHVKTTDTIETLSSFLSIV